MVHLINTSDLMRDDWRFVAPLMPDDTITWSFHRGVPASSLERAVRRPNLARYRAAWTAVREAAAADDAILISHLPTMAAATNLLRRRLAPRVPHAVFALNFTDMPEGARRGYFRSALSDVAEAVVFSRMEEALYQDLLALPADRLRFVPWAMDAPEPGSVNPAEGFGPYISAVGGEARDYATLARAMATLPDLRLAIVARPYSVAGIDIPANVRVFTNLPYDQCWRLAVDSLGMAIPLRAPDTACGHVTMVGAQLLGIPLTTTRSTGTADYVDEETAFMTEAGDVDAMAGALRRLAEDREEAGRRAARAQAIAAERSDPRRWAAYVRDLAARLSRGPADRAA